MNRVRLCQQHTEMDKSSVHPHSAATQQVICEEREREPLKLELLATRLYEAALVGDVSSLLDVLRLDASILDRCRIQRLARGFIQSPLHIAADLGHLDFVNKILESKPELAEERDHKQGCTPLHLSAAKGHLEIVNVLLAVNPNLCLERNEIGRNPVHVAAVKGQKLVLGKLLEANPQAAYERTSIGETVLHLCVKHNQLETLKFLVEFIGNAPLLNAKDSIGDTILHLALATRQVEMQKFLLGDERIEKNAINANGYTAMDVSRKVRGKNSIDQEIRDCLEGAKALPGKAAKKLQERDHTWSLNQHDALMVVASLIATMAFQVAMNPPGGVWQDNNTLSNVSILDGYYPIKNQTITPAPGESIFGYIDSENYAIFVVSNAIAFASSVSVILLLISGFRYNQYVSIILTIIMWIALSATIVTYWIGSYFVIPSVLGDIAHGERVWSLFAWAMLLACLFLGHGIRVTKNSNLGQSIIRKLQLVSWNNIHEGS
ncbi:hypothetical protein Cgig2_002150 [Carnegiea gigantea]|uniref:PGG domain-containing protein n=1 Tax=Carnegiea gigantea TaxID=171969 RepID=A0A9Q1QSA0_9CARY|nr:hypothetical protein Cgig2_002150 [Carnegiea gigantea]